MKVTRPKGMKTKRPDPMIQTRPNQKALAAEANPVPPMPDFGLKQEQLEGLHAASKKMEGIKFNGSNTIAKGMSARIEEAINKKDKDNG